LASIQERLLPDPKGLDAFIIEKKTWLEMSLVDICRVTVRMRQEYRGSGSEISQLRAAVAAALVAPLLLVPYPSTLLVVAIVLVATFIVARRVWLPGIPITGREVRRRWPTFIRSRTPVHVRVRRIVARGATVRIVITSRRIILNRAATRGRPIAASSVIVVVPPRRGALAVSITIATRLPAGAVTTGGDAGRRSTTVLIVASRRIAATWGPRTSTIGPRNVRLGVGDTGDTLTLEVAAIELLHGSPQVRGSLKLNKAFTIAVAASFRVYDVKPGSASEIFQILPRSISREPADLHAVRRAARPRSRVSVVAEPVCLAMTGASGELDRQALAHEIGTMEGWNDISRVHRIFVFDEP